MNLWYFIKAFFTIKRAHNVHTLVADDEKPTPPPWVPDELWQPSPRPPNPNLHMPQDSLVPSPMSPPPWVPEPMWEPSPMMRRNPNLYGPQDSFVPPPPPPGETPSAAQYDDDEIAARFRNVERVSAELASAVAELRRALPAQTGREVGPGHNQGPPILPDELDAETEHLIALLKEKGPRPAPADRALINAQAEKTLQLSEQITGWMKAAGWMVAGVAVREVTKDLTAPLWERVARKMVELYHAIMAWLSLFM